MNTTLHFEGYAKDIDLKDLLSDNYSLGFSFGFDEETSETINNVFFRFYECDSKCSLEEALEGHLSKMFGNLEATGQEYGYSEYTIEGFTISSLTLGGHDIGRIINSKGDKYLHILIDIINK